MQERKVILYISMSVDGFIATKDDGLDWLAVAEQEGEDYGYKALEERVDTYIVGRTTYETILTLTGGKFPQADLYDCYVLTRQERPNEAGIQFYNGDLKTLITDLKAQPGKHIYCDGGGQVVQAFMAEDLIDEYIISVIPVLLGDGKRLFLGDVTGKKLKAKPSQYFESGVVQLRYERI